MRDLELLGAVATKRQTPGHPMVVGHVDGAGPHILFYGHYDVQPVDPIELWHRDPFDPAVEQTPKVPIRGRDRPTIRGIDDLCRGLPRVESGAWYIALQNHLFFEGEEESGSPSLIPFMKENAAELTSDIVLICDTGLFESKTPAIVTMLRGLLGEEIKITGPNKDCILACMAVRP